MCLPIVIAAYGGVAPKAIMAVNAAAAMAGQPLSQATLAAALAALRQDVKIGPDAPGGRSEYRQSLAASFLLKFFAQARVKADSSNHTVEQCVALRS